MINLGMFRAIFPATNIIRLISQVIRTGIDTHFYKINDPQIDTAYLSPNNLQESSNANSYTWSEFNENGKITRQLTTVVVNLIPIDYQPQNSVQGIPTNIFVLQGGVHIAKLPINVSLSRHLEVDTIFRQLTSPAFLYTNVEANTCIGIITVTMQDAETGLYLDHCRVSRWSAEYNHDDLSVLELIENETVELDISGKLKQRITLNQDGSKGAFVATNKGYILDDLKLPIFAPTYRLVVDVEPEEPLYGDYVTTGSGSYDYNKENYRVAQIRREYYSYDNTFKDCTRIANLSKRITVSVLTKDSVRSNEQETDIDRPGTLLAFGYDILTDVCNVFIERPRYFKSSDSHVYIEKIESLYTPIPAESDEAYSASDKDIKHTISISVEQKGGIEFSVIPDTSNSTNPSGQIIIDAGYEYNNEYHESVISDSRDDTDTEIITTNFNQSTDTLFVIGIVDIATGTIHVIKENWQYTNTDRTLTTEHLFLAALNSETLLHTTNTNSTYTPPPIYAGGTGTVTNESTTYPGIVEPITPSASPCLGLPTWSGDPCPAIPDSCLVYKIGNAGNVTNEGSTVLTEYIDTWDYV